MSGAPSECEQHAGLPTDRLSLGAESVDSESVISAAAAAMRVRAILQPPSSALFVNPPSVLLPHPHPPLSLSLLPQSKCFRGEA